ncbi:hypothetical protein PFNF135_06232 [Plasmodium falciparum NF135/5.C10]|uniref:Uncharacterized protein n=1 Tax=Plasmodium falciparum NF135/5.C10 TaxID=1036726 RepID=W4I6P5_PLAFA|nr:hypothetical protein PFNF135_06232 [Plasmodium falciparum NF135/5.C10]
MNHLDKINENSKNSNNNKRITLENKHNGVNYDDGNLLYDSIWHQTIYSRFETVASEKIILTHKNLNYKKKPKRSSYKKSKKS